jgi:hypothetical protein
MKKQTKEQAMQDLHKDLGKMSPEDKKALADQLREKYLKQPIR